MSIYSVLPTSEIPKSHIQEKKGSAVQPLTINNKIINIADNAFPNSQLESTQVNRYGFLINRFRSIHITLSKKFTFTIEDFMVRPDIRYKVIKKIQGLLQKRINKVWREFLSEANNVKDNVKSKSVQEHFSTLHNFVKIVAESESILGKNVKNISYFDNLLSLILNVTKLPGKIQDFQEGMKGINFNNPQQAFESFNTLLEGIYDSTSIGTSIIKKLENNAYIKIAYETIGLGKDFTPFGSEVIELVSAIEIPLTAFRIYLKAVSLHKSFIVWQTTIPKKELNKARIELLRSSLDLAKELAKATILALTTLGIIPQAPIIVTIIISGIGIVSISIKIFTYFSQRDNKKTQEKENAQTVQFRNSIESASESSEDETDSDLDSEELMIE